MAEAKCPRCGHTFTRRKYARKVTPHTTNRLTPDGVCGNCRDCFEWKLTKGESE